MKLFVICTLVASAYSLPLDGEGVPTKNVPALDSRIFNGRQATLGQFPWQALLYTLFYDSSGMFCGGSLIHTRWVLTAAHCLDSNSRVPRNIYIWFGTIDIADASGSVFRQSTDYEIHEAFDNFYNDIALVKLNEIVPDTEHVRTITLGNYLDPGLNVEVSGFGRTQTGSINTQLRYAELITIRNEECIRSNAFPVRISEVCATPGNGSPCYGDSGSPLVMQVNGVWEQFGVVVNSVDPGCQLNTTVFSRISYYRNWILQMIESHQ